MTTPGIVEISPITMTTDHGTGIPELLAHLGEVEEAIGSVPGPRIDVSRDDRLPGANVRLSLATRGSTVIDLSFAVEDHEGPTVGRWLEADPSHEVVRIARQALLDASLPTEPTSLDEADLIVCGLAWSLMDGHPRAAATIHRATPWSPARITVGSLRSDGDVFRFAAHEPTPVQSLALQAMRPGTRIRPENRSLGLYPIGIRLETRTADAVTRLRETAMWLDFERSRS